MKTFPTALPWIVPGGSEAALRGRARQLRLHVAVHPVLHLGRVGRPSPATVGARPVVGYRAMLAAHPRTPSKG